MIPGQLIYIEAQTGNGNNKYREFSNHNISGHYEFVREDETTIWLKEEKIVFPVLKSKIAKIEKID